MFGSVFKKGEFMKLGDKVIFTWLTSESKSNEAGLLTRIGVIVKDNKDKTFNVLYFEDHFLKVATNINRNYIKPMSELENEKEVIINTYDNLIDKEKSKLKTVSQEEKDQEKITRFNNIKQRIVKNCEWLLHNDIDDEDFVNRVKEISNLKKQLFSPEKLQCINEIHRFNGTIKYNIRELQRERDSLLKRLSNEDIMRRLSDF
jgi:hypothetical protein